MPPMSDLWQLTQHDSKKRKTAEENREQFRFEENQGVQLENENKSRLTDRAIKGLHCISLVLILATLHVAG